MKSTGGLDTVCTNINKSQFNSVIIQYILTKAVEIVKSCVTGCSVVNSQVRSNEAQMSSHGDSGSSLRTDLSNLSCVPHKGRKNVKKVRQTFWTLAFLRSCGKD